jgi:thiol-disulfide isomerase/thioredoxin
MTVMHLRRWLLGIVLLALVACACGPEVRRVETYGPDGASALPSSPTALPEHDFETYTALLEDLRGTPVVVNVWASWCGPCREEAPALAAASTQYGDRVQFLGLDVLDAKPDARAFIEESGWSYPSLYDQTGAIRDHLGLLGQPVTIFYDSEGNVVQTHVGAIEPDELTRQLEALLAG